MKKLSAVLSVGLLLCAGRAVAQDRWYVGLSGGAYFRDGVNTASNFTSMRLPGVVVPGTNAFAYETGGIAGLALGYRLTSRLRGELELSYANYLRSAVFPNAADLRFPNLNGGRFDRRSGGIVERAGGSANLFYDFGAPTAALRPYVGLGIGGAYTHATSGTYASANGSTFREDASSGSDGFGLVEGGVSLRLGRRWALVPAYRYERFFMSNGDSTSIAKLGVRYTF